MTAEEVFSALYDKYGVDLTGTCFHYYRQMETLSRN